LYTASLLSVWAFIWDDTIDTNEGDLAMDFASASRYRKQSLAYVRYWLALDIDTGIATACRSSIADSLSSAVVASLWGILSDILVYCGWTTSPELKVESVAEPECPSKPCLIFKEFGQRICDDFDSGNASHPRKRKKVDLHSE